MGANDLLPSHLPPNVRKMLEKQLIEHKNTENTPKIIEKGPKQALNCPILKRIFTNYGLKPTKNPVKNPCLSGVVEVIDLQGRGWCNISFQQPFVQRLVKCMPAGLSPVNPGVLKLMYRPVDRVWGLYCRYFDNGKGILLAEYHSPPAWCGTIFRPKVK